MGRILIVTYDEYRNISYVEKYEKSILDHAKEYDIILWDRSGDQKCDASNHIVFSGMNRRSKLLKIIPFLRWRRLVKRQLKKVQYDRLIVLTTIPAVLLADVLLFKYAKRYWLDVRDYTYEHIGLYHRIVKKLVERSAGMSISSPGFYSFIPRRDNVYLTHNITNTSARKKECTLDVEHTPILIGFVGGVQYPEENKRLCMQLNNHPRYSLRYVGKVHPGCDLRGFCAKIHMTNVEFLPPYENRQKPAIYDRIDLINSVYGASTPVTRIALPNRLYDAALYKKPILVSKGTLLSQIVESNSMGLAIDTQEADLAGKLDAYLQQFDRDAFVKGCDAFLSGVIRDEEQMKMKIDEFVDEKYEE